MDYEPFVIGGLITVIVFAIYWIWSNYFDT